MRAFIDFLDSPATASSSAAISTSPGVPTSGTLPSTARLRAQFEHPIAILRADHLNEVVGVLQQVQEHALAGRWCVGAVAYEAAAAFDAALHTQEPRPHWPLAQFAVYERALPWPLDSDTDSAALNAWLDPSLDTSFNSLSSKVGDWILATSQQDYSARLERARAAIEAGQCYQINLTEMLETQFMEASPVDLPAWFARLRAAQPGGYTAWLDWGDQQLLSVSPELFFDWRPEIGEQGRAGWLKCQPMKGTAPRYADASLDAQSRQHLSDSEKERAENLMIVDLLRSDMGRIAQLGSVAVSDLFAIQALPTVWQMTTTIQAQTRPEVGLVDLFRALFPCGSVTGAPKVQAMRWIRELEHGPRGMYCGAIGVVRPGGAAIFNVPIRTIALEREGGKDNKAPAETTWTARCGVGSAVTFYAEAQAEWRELSAKTRFLERARRRFELLETLRLENGKYWLLEAHLQRLSTSAAYFGFEFNADKAQAYLHKLAVQHTEGVYRVRLTVSATGQLDAQAVVLETTEQPILFNISELPIESMGREHEFIVHKTTRREHYENRLRVVPGVFDTLLINERGEITEFTRGNVALKLNGKWLTPPISCGLLPGTYRADLLARGEISEAVLKLDDLNAATEVTFLNSVRGWVAAKLNTDN